MHEHTLAALAAILLFLFISMAVVVILFEGGPNLKLKDIPGLERGIRNLITFGVLLGAAGGYGFGIIIRRHWLPQYLQNFAALAWVCGILALSDILEAESGLLSVTVMGVWLANLKGIEMDEILDFKESLRVLLISKLFIRLAKGAEIKTAPLTEKISYEDDLQHQEEQRLPRFAIDLGGRIHSLTAETEIAAPGRLEDHRLDRSSRS